MSEKLEQAKPHQDQKYSTTFKAVPDKELRSWIVGNGGFLMAFVLVVWITGGVLVFNFAGRSASDESANILSVAGTFGDMFGAVNALFSGLAFAGVLLALVLQTRELSYQRESIKEQLKSSYNSYKYTIQPIVLVDSILVSASAPKLITIEGSQDIFLSIDLSITAGVVNHSDHPAVNVDLSWENPFTEVKLISNELIEVESAVRRGSGRSISCIGPAMKNGTVKATRRLISRHDELLPYMCFKSFPVTINIKYRNLTGGTFLTSHIFVVSCEGDDNSGLRMWFNQCESVYTEMDRMERRSVKTGEPLQTEQRSELVKTLETIFEGDRMANPDGAPLLVSENNDEFTVKIDDKALSVDLAG